MKRLLAAAGLVALIASTGMAQDSAKLQDYAKQQDDLMKVTIGKPYYGILWQMTRGRKPYDQAAVETALAEVEQAVAKIPQTFEQNPKANLPGAEYGASQKVWQQKSDFDAKVPAVQKAIADAKTSVKDLDTLKTAFQSINAKCDACHDDYRLKLKK